MYAPVECEKRETQGSALEWFCSLIQPIDIFRSLIEHFTEGTATKLLSQRNATIYIYIKAMLRNLMLIN